MKLLGIAVASMIVTVAALTAMVERKYEWPMANEFNAESLHAEGDRLFAQKLTDLSRGAISITHHFGGSFGVQSQQQIEAVASGVLPMANSFAGVMAELEPVWSLPTLPFIAATPEQARELYEVAKPLYEKAFLKRNQKLLYASPWPPSGIWAKTPMESLEALAGVRVRVSDATGAAALKRAGAEPIQLLWADVAPQLAIGGIAGVLASAEQGLDSRLWEHLPHFTQVHYAMPLNMATINLDVWKSLSPDLQLAVREAAQAVESHNWRAVGQRVESSYAKMRQLGVTVVDEAPPEFLEALRAVGQEAREAWLEKLRGFGQEILTEYQERCEVIE